MREFRPYGSVRGALSNGRPYRDNYETRKKALRHKGFLLFLTRSALSAAVSKYHAVANGRDTPDSGRCWNDFGDRAAAAMRQGTKSLPR